MNITYNATDRVFEFKDKLALRYRLIYITMIALLISSGIDLYRALPTGIGWSDVLDLFVVVSACLVLTMPFKKTGQENVPVEAIEGLQVKTVLGRKRYALRLKNGKVRDVLDVDSQVEENRPRRLLVKAGVG